MSSNSTAKLIDRLRCIAVHLENGDKIQRNAYDQSGMEYWIEEDDVSKLLDPFFKIRAKPKPVVVHTEDSPPIDWMDYTERLMALAREAADTSLGRDVRHLHNKLNELASERPDVFQKKTNIPQPGQPFPFESVFTDESDPVDDPGCKEFRLSDADRKRLQELMNSKVDEVFDDDDLRMFARILLSLEVSTI